MGCGASSRVHEVKILQSPEAGTETIRERPRPEMLDLVPAKKPSCKPQRRRTVPVSSEDVRAWAKPTQRARKTVPVTSQDLEGWIQSV